MRSAPIAHFTNPTIPSPLVTTNLSYEFASVLFCLFFGSRGFWLLGFVGFFFFFLCMSEIMWYLSFSIQMFHLV